MQQHDTKPTLLRNLKIKQQTAIKNKIRIMDTTQQQLHDLLNHLENELQVLNLWETAAPSDHDLSSSEPFCVDTLSLTQWLQWLLIPRMHALLEGDLPLPNNCNIHPFAIENFKGMPEDCSTLLRVIQQIDQVLSADSSAQN